MFERKPSLRATEHLLTVVYRIMAPRDVHIPVSTTHEYVILHSKMNVADKIKIRTLRWGDYPDYLGGPSQPQGSPEESKSEREDVRTKSGVTEERCCAAGSEGGGRGQEPRNAGRL